MSLCDVNHGTKYLRRKLKSDKNPAAKAKAALPVPSWLTASERRGTIFNAVAAQLCAFLSGSYSSSIRNLSGFPEQQPAEGRSPAVQSLQAASSHTCLLCFGFASVLPGPPSIHPSIHQSIHHVADYIHLSVPLFILASDFCLGVNFHCCSYSPSQVCNATHPQRFQAN